MVSRNTGPVMSYAKKKLMSLIDYSPSTGDRKVENPDHQTGRDGDEGES